jgi:hypothetical protein
VIVNAEGDMKTKVKRTTRSSTTAAKKRRRRISSSKYYERTIVQPAARLIAALAGKATEAAAG